MKKIYFLTIFLTTFILAFSCSDSGTNFIDSCERSNWYGIYDKVSEECDNGGVPLFEEIATWKEGSCENCISGMSSTEYRINEDCRVVYTTPLGLEVITELNGELLNVEVTSLNCKATYKKRN